jgi:hypothetical protein
MERIGTSTLYDPSSVLTDSDAVSMPRSSFCDRERSARELQFSETANGQHTFSRRWTLMLSGEPSGLVAWTFESRYAVDRPARLFGIDEVGSLRR